MLNSNWQHAVAVEWLKERKKYLTATDIADIMPSALKWKAGQPVGYLPNAVITKLTEKLYGEITDDQIYSSGAAARGHLLEPFAVDEFNYASASMTSSMSVNKFYHWDDMLIYNISSGLSFSPDALTADPYIHCLMNVHALEHNSPIVFSTAALEIKCYSSGAHMQALWTPKMKHKERYQLAVAMEVMPSICYGVLVFFNPKLEKHGLHCKIYTPAELVKEREDIRHTVKYWHEAVKAWKKHIELIPRQCQPINTEEVIIKRLIDEGKIILS